MAGKLTVNWKPMKDFMLSMNGYNKKPHTHFLRKTYTKLNTPVFIDMPLLVTISSESLHTNMALRKVTVSIHSATQKPCKIKKNAL